MLNLNKIERYPMKYSRFSSHTRISRIIHAAVSHNEKTSVLDVGCSKGGLFKLLPGESITYLGVEPYLEDFTEAQKLGIPVLNLDAHDALREVNDLFDFVVFADVLEHIANPETVLIETHKVLTPNGKVVISVPNIAHFSTRLLLFFGLWNYTQRGILDKTHLRFFTKKSLKKFVTENSFEVVDWIYTPIPIEALPLRIPSFLFNIFDYLNYSVTRFMPRLFAFQFVVILVPKLNQENLK